MKVEAWVVLKATRSQYGGRYPTGSPYAGQAKVGKVRITKVAQNKPAVGEDEITMKMELDVPEEWFLDGTATIKATIPPPDPTDHDIDGTVDLPIRPKARSAAASVVHP